MEFTLTLVSIQRPWHLQHAYTMRDNAAFTERTDNKPNLYTDDYVGVSPGRTSKQWVTFVKGLFFRVRGHLCYTMTTISPGTPEICWGTSTVTPHSLVPVHTPQLSPECLMHLGLPGLGQFEGIWKDRLLIRILNMRQRLWGEVSGVVGFLSFLMEMQSVQPEQRWKCHRAYHSMTALPTETEGRDWQISHAMDGHRYVTCISFIMMRARVQCVRKRW